MKFISRNNSIFSSIINFLLINYYVILSVVYLFGLILPDIRNGLIMAFFMLLLVLLHYKSLLYRKKTLLDLLVLFYVFWNTISLVWLFFSDITIDIFIAEYSNTILPIVFYFFGRKFLLGNKFLFYSIFFLTGIFILTFILNLSLFEPYLVFIMRLDNVGSMDPSSFILFRSLFGLTVTGTLSAIGVILSFDKFLFNKKYSYFLVFLVYFIALILASRRSAIYASIFGVVFLNIYYLYFKGISFVRFLIFEWLILSFCFLIFFFVFPEMKEFSFDRIVNYNEAINERRNNWEVALSSANWLLGEGFSSFSHKAEIVKKFIIPDNAYLRILAEVGVIGVISFFSIIFLTMYLGFGNVSNNYLYLIICIVFILQGIGSDIFSFQVVAPFFWFSVGRIGNTIFKISNL